MTSDDYRDANRLIIEAVPALVGSVKRLLEPYQAMHIRGQIAKALGMEDDDLASRLAHFKRTGEVKEMRS